MTGAEASFELLARRTLGEVPDFFRVAAFCAAEERRWTAGGELVARGPKPLSRWRWTGSCNSGRSRGR